MSTNWTETAEEICRDALEHLAVVGANDAVTAVDFNKALRALNSVLKSLPLVGYSWPKLSTDTALTWSALTPQTIDLPSDFYNYPVVHVMTSDGRKRLAQIPHGYWVNMQDQSATGPYPTHFYVSPDNTLYFWPVPTQDPDATLQYQRIVDDVVRGAQPDIPQYWINPLGWGVADELSLDYGINAQDRAEIRQRWIAKSTQALESSMLYEQISVTVDDGNAVPAFNPLNQ
jgi:hypothetical protein